MGKEFIKTVSNRTHFPVIWLYTNTEHRIPAVFVNTNSKYTVIFSHGNAEDLARVASWIRTFSMTLKVNTLAYDYPGYGLTQDSKMSEPREDFCHAAAHAAYRYLVDVVGISPDRIILYGRSLGGSVSSQLAQATARDGCPPAGLIIQSAPLSAMRVAIRVRGGCSLPWDRLNTGSTIVGVKCPTLVIHGDSDKMVPFWHGKELYKLIPKRYRVEPLWLKGAGHNDVETVGFRTGLLTSRIRTFLDHDVTPSSTRRKK